MKSNQSFKPDEIKQMEEANLPKIKPFRWSKSVIEMSNVISSDFQRSGLPPELAKQVSFRSLVVLGKYFGGRQFYLPRSLQRFVRNIAIYEEFTGDNVFELSAKYGLTLVHVYKIISEQRELRSNQDYPVD